MLAMPLLAMLLPVLMLAVLYDDACGARAVVVLAVFPVRMLAVMCAWLPLMLLALMLAVPGVCLVCA
jgi:hypothetical protein